MGHDCAVKRSALPVSVSTLRGLAGIVVAAAIWEVFARSDLFSAALTPSLVTIGRLLLDMILDGTLLTNLAATLGRVALGLAISFAMALPLGMLMGRNRFAERFSLPLISLLLPIPSLAWVPLFTLWFGIGNAATISVVVYASFFPLVYNIWAGGRAVNPLWVRAASVMGAGRIAMMRNVILPASLPYIITGLRLGLGRAWIGVIGGELLASPTYGLGQIIFNAKEFLNAGVMLAVLLLIGLIGVFFERFVFHNLERVTIGRWGMMLGERV